MTNRAAAPPNAIWQLSSHARAERSARPAAARARRCAARLEREQRSGDEAREAGREEQRHEAERHEDDDDGHTALLSIHAHGASDCRARA